MKRILTTVVTLLVPLMLTQLTAQVFQTEEIGVLNEPQKADNVGVNNLEKTNAQVEAKPFGINGKFGFFLIGGYAFGLNGETTGSGAYTPEDSDISSNDFYLKYARINGAFNITPKLKANLLFNLADFKNGEVSRRVLEIASVTYQFNKMFNLRVGQFRPYYGIENTYGIANHLSNAWSNTYSVLGKSNWQSFQIGASLYGNLNEKNIPFKYYLNVYNGNGKNRPADNDSNKNVSARIVLTALPGVEIGANYATAQHLEEDVNATTFDFKTGHDINSHFELNTEFSYALGHNLWDATRLDIPAEDLDNYEFSGWYFTPQIVYKTNNPNLKSVAFSCRYESLNANKEFVDNVRTTITPMVDFNIDKNFRASVVGVFNSYDEEDATSNMMDTQWMQLQLQFNY